MEGLSWSGFNCLQVAAMQPKSLKAVLSVCSTDDRYADDIHYMGGCLLNDNMKWAANMFSHNSRPPDPEIAGNRWRTQIIADLRKVMKLNRHHSLFKAGRLAESLAEHRAVMQALEARDAAKAQRLMRAHFENGLAAAGG